MTAGKVLVFHTGARDEYQVAWALHEAHRLECLVTNGYKRESESIFESIAARPKLIQRRLESRHCAAVPDDRVDSNLLPELVVHAASTISEHLGNWAFAWQERVLAERCAKLALERQAIAVLSYNYCAYHLFHRLRGTGIKRLLFQCHPHPDTVISALADGLQEGERVPRSMAQEKEVGWGRRYVDQLRSEPQLADHIFAASSFTKKSLLSAGISDQKITVVPYGSDSRLGVGPASDSPPSKTSRLRLLYVGQMGHRKGIRFLLDACNALNRSDFELRLCGRGFDLDDSCVTGSSAWLSVKRNLTDEQLRQEYLAADVFILPSLVEGFGLVLLEALAFGLPVIATVSTGAPDVIVDGEHGLLVPAADANSLKRAIETLLNDRSRLAAMQSSARDRARAFTWEKFRTKIISTLDCVL